MSQDSSSVIIAALFEREKRTIFEFSHWQEILKDIGLNRYEPIKTPLSKLIEKIEKYHSSAESEEHKQLKVYIGAHPACVELPRTSKLMGFEIILPSADRLDILFRADRQLIAIEVKPSNVDEAELTRGLYQCIKYKALLAAQQIDLGESIRVDAKLACNRLLTESESRRAELLGIETFYVSA